MMGSFYSVEAKFKSWEVAANPVGPSGTETTSGYWPNWMAIPTASNNPDEAFKYLDYIAVTGAQEQFAAFPDLPTNAKVADGHRAQQAGREAAAQEYADRTPPRSSANHCRSPRRCGTRRCRRSPSTS